MLEIEEYMMKWIFTMLSAVLVGITGVIPVLLIPLDKSNYLNTRDGQNYMNYFLSFAVGSILGDVFMHLLPETWELYTTYPEVGNYQNIGICIITGIVLFLIIEKICTTNGSDTIAPDENHTEIKKEKKNQTHENQVMDGKKSKSVRRRKSKEPNDLNDHNDHNEVVEERPSPVHIEGYLNLLANVIDNFAHGLAVGGSYTVSPSVGFLTTVCILIHEIPHEVSDFVILLRAGFDKKRAIFAQLSTASSSLLGAVMALVVDSATAGLSKAYILPFSCGGFIYVALVTLVPNLTREEDPRESSKQVGLIILGIALTSVLALANV